MLGSHFNRFHYYSLVAARYDTESPRYNLPVEDRISEKLFRGISPWKEVRNKTLHLSYKSRREWNAGVLRYFRHRLRCIRHWISTPALLMLFTFPELIKQLSKSHWFIQWYPVAAIELGDPGKP